MDHARPGTRRVITYASSQRAQPRSETSTTHLSSTKRRNDCPSRPQGSKPASRGSIRANDETKETPARTPNTTTTIGSRAAPDHSIFDLPSSDEQEKSSTTRRKRRRNGSKEMTPSSRTYADFRTSRRNGASSDTTDVSEFKADTTKAIFGAPSPSTRRTARSHQTSLSLDSHSKYQDLAQGASQSPLGRKSPRVRMLQDSQSSSREIESTWRAEASSRSPASPSHRSPTRAARGQDTPNRRRLIDSLATKEDSVDIASDSTPLHGLLPSPFVSGRSSQPLGSKSPSTMDSNQHDGLAKESTVPQSPHLKGSKVTYARQRSFLDDLSIAGGLVGQDSQSEARQMDTSISPQRELRSLVMSRSAAVEEVHEDDGTVRSIHELRQAGGNARYRGAVESIFEDIEDLHNSALGRCNAFVQLCGKLLDPKLARQFVECGFDRRLVDNLSNDLDAVSAALAFSAFDLTFNGRPLPYLLATAAWPKLLDMSLTWLNAQDDILAVAHARGIALSKPIQRAVRDVCSRVVSALFADISPSKLSPCVLALRCLKLTMAAFHEKDETPTGLPTSVLKQLMDLLLSQFPQSAGSSALAPDQSIVLGLGLSVLEAHTVSGASFHQDQSGILSLLSNMHGLLQWKDDSGVINQHVQMLFIRVLLNVTNSDSKLCDDFGSGAMVGQLAEIALANLGDTNKESLAKEGNSLDTVILALGTLVNLTEQSEATRAMFLRSHSKTQSPLDRLLRFFSAHVGSTSKVCQDAVNSQDLNSDTNCLGSFGLGSTPQRGGWLSSSTSFGTLLRSQRPKTSQTFHACRWPESRHGNSGGVSAVPPENRARLGYSAGQRSGKWLRPQAKKPVGPNPTSRVGVILQVRPPRLASNCAFVSQVGQYRVE